MDKTQQVWGGEWAAKISGRLRSLGFQSVSAYLASVPSLPYIKAALRLGDDVAAKQLEWMQFAEAVEQGQLREAAADCLTRELTSHLKRGWGRGMNLDFNTAKAVTDWVNNLQEVDPAVVPYAESVWRALQELHPPSGWLPASSSDDLIRAALDAGWPS